MKEKIEEIVNKYTNSPMAFADGVERVTFQERYFPVSDLVKELSTLIQQERKEAVRGFADLVYESFRNHDLKIHALIEEYLESEGVKEHEKDDTKKYTCPDCGLEHSEEHHPPYCQDCIFKVTL